MSKSSGGRPRHGEQVKSVPLGIRTDPELREKIEEAAESRGVSLTQEVERRLRESFDRNSIVLSPEVRAFVEFFARVREVSVAEEIDDRVQYSMMLDGLFGSSETSRLLRSIGHSIELVEMETGKRWFDDPETYGLAKRAIRQIVDALEPPAEEDPEAATLVQRYSETMEEYRVVFLERRAHAEKYGLDRFDRAQDALVDGEIDEAEYNRICEELDVEAVRAARDLQGRERRLLKEARAIKNQLDQLREPTAAATQRRRRVNTIAKVQSEVASGRMSIADAQEALGIQRAIPDLAARGE